MQIQVIAEGDGTGETNLQSRVTELLAELGNDNRKTVQGDAYGASGLVDILEVRATDEQREVVVLNCSRQQIQAVLEWQACCEDENEFQDLVLYLVRNQSSAL